MRRRNPFEPPAAMARLIQRAVVLGESSVPDLPWFVYLMLLASLGLLLFAAFETTTLPATEGHSLAARTCNDL